MTGQTRTGQTRTGQTRSFPVTWDDLHRDTRALAWRLADLGPFDAIVAQHFGGNFGNQPAMSVE